MFVLLPEAALPLLALSAVLLLYYVVAVSVLVELAAVLVSVEEEFWALLPTELLSALGLVLPIKLGIPTSLTILPIELVIVLLVPELLGLALLFELLYLTAEAAGAGGAGGAGILTLIVYVVERGL